MKRDILDEFIKLKRLKKPIKAMLIPSILSTTEADFKEKVATINNSPNPEIEWVHIDVMDNKFVQNQSVSVEVIKKYPLQKKIEVHLMVEDPFFYISQFKDFPVDRFIIHSEVEPELIDKAISWIRTSSSAHIGLALNPETEISKIEELNLVEVIDLALIMSVHPGFGGQIFIPETLSKIAECSSLREQYSQRFLIEVDGGITKDNAKDIIKASADNLVVGASLFQGNFDENIKNFTQ